MKAKQIVNNINRNRKNEQARKLEKQLILRLDRIVNEIKDTNIKDIFVLQRQYNTQVEHALRSAIEKAYILAAEKTVNIRKRKQNKIKFKEAAALSDLTSHFTTATDLKNIANKVGQYVGVFWRRMNGFIHRNDVQPNPTGFNPGSKYNINSVVTGMGTSAITDAMTDGTLSKLDQLGEPNEKVKWVTQMDERTCPFCNSLEGQIWNINDPDLKTPPDSSHENCRCTLEPLTGDEREVTSF